MAERHGFRRAVGPAGARNFVLALPSVVCAGLVAERLGGDDVVALPHQHGCLHVGDDLSHTAGVLTGLGTNPNVAETLVVSLGCETLQGRRLVDAITDRGVPAEIVVIQSVGGTAEASRVGEEAVRAMRDRYRTERVAVPASDALVGLDAAQSKQADAVAAELTARGMRVEQADGLLGPEAHSELAAAGAQVIVSLPGPLDAPVGFPLCPVVAVGTDSDLHAALADDFDLLIEAGTSDKALATSVADEVERVFDGALTAAERRGSAEFCLRRLAITM
jgi:altronate dehydratase